MTTPPQLILGSGSPRRRELLQATGIDFRIDPAGVDEDLAKPAAGELPWGERPEHAARLLAERKALAVGERYRGQTTLVLGADTVVAAEGQLLGKPVDRDDARAMLTCLGGISHRVVTGVCVLRCSDWVWHSAWERTWVHMHPLDGAQIEGYLDTGEWTDKAGGYGIQGAAGAFVRSIEGGGWDNVVGLPLDLARWLLERLSQAIPQ